MDAEEFFRSEWPGLSSRIAAALGRRGVPRHDRDDVLQETAIRLYRTWDQVDPARPVEPYVFVVALNVWRDQLRRRPSEDLVDELPDTTSTGADDVERTCLVRDELGRVRRAMGLLRPEQRQVLRAVAAAELGGDLVDGPAPDALRMARMRARRQLRAALQAASAFAGAVFVRFRRGPVVSVTAVSVALVMAVLTDIGGTDQPRSLPTRPVQPVVSDQISEPVTPVVERAPVLAPAARQVAPPVRRRVQPPVQKAPDMYWIESGPARVGLRFDIGVNEHKVVIGDGGNGLPVCAQLEPTSPTPADQLRCRRP